DADQRQQESIRPEADDNCRKQKGLDKRVAGAATRQVIRIGRNLPVERAYRQEQQIDRCKQNVEAHRGFDQIAPQQLEDAQAEHDPSSNGKQHVHSVSTSCGWAIVSIMRLEPPSTVRKIPVSNTIVEER